MTRHPSTVAFWLSELITPWDIHLTGITHVWAHQKTAFQEMYVVETTEYGRALILDADWQSSQVDEFLYHEPLVHPAMICHGAPRNVLILGGGEGATAREVLRWQTVERVVMVDIDGDVIAACRAYLPDMHGGAFEDPRLEVCVDDALNFLAAAAPEWDVVIFDLSDPVEDGPAKPLFCQECFAQIRKVLKPDGWLALQAGSLAPPDLARHARLARTVESVFPHIRSYHSEIPSFRNPWGFILASALPIPDQPEPTTIDRQLQANLTGTLRMLDGVTFLGMMQTQGNVRRAIATQTQIYTMTDLPQFFGPKGVEHQPVAQSEPQLQTQFWLQTPVFSSEHHRYAHGVEQVLASQTHTEHDWCIFETGTYGKALILNGVWQASTVDAYLYYEPLVHPALIHQGQPQQILILGDCVGAATREVLRWPSIKQVRVMVPDAEVVSACRQHLQELQAGAFEDARVEVVVGKDWGKVAIDRLETIAPQTWDIVIVDMRHQPSEVLPNLTIDEVSQLRQHLKPDGVLAMQMGGMPPDVEPYLQRVQPFQSVFKHVKFYSSFVPTQAQAWGFLMASDQRMFSDGVEGGDGHRSIGNHRTLASRGVEGLQMIDEITMLGLMQTPKHIRKAMAAASESHP